MCRPFKRAPLRRTHTWVRPYKYFAKYCQYMSPPSRNRKTLDFFQENRYPIYYISL
jgi:hypothetical protein